MYIRVISADRETNNVNSVTTIKEIKKFHLFIKKYIKPKAKLTNKQEFKTHKNVKPTTNSGLHV